MRRKTHEQFRTDLYSTGHDRNRAREIEEEDLDQGRRQVVSTFLRAALLAVPSARQNGMNGSSLPEFVLELVAGGQPFQLANAFESPVRPEGAGWVKPSTEALERHFAKLKAVFGLQSSIREEARLSEETPLDRFIETLAAYPADTAKEQFARVCDAVQYKDGTDTWNDAPLGFGRPNSSGIEGWRFCPRRVKMIAP
jgi:hypothetical protein